MTHESGSTPSNNWKDSGGPVAQNERLFLQAEGNGKRKFLRVGYFRQGHLSLGKSGGSVWQVPPSANQVIQIDWLKVTFLGEAKLPLGQILS